MPRKLVSLFVCAALAGACGDSLTKGAGEPDATGGRDAARDAFAGGDGPQTGPTGGGDGGPSDFGTGGGGHVPDAAPEPGTFGAPCTEGIDCLSGYCVPAPNGQRVCTELCGGAADCPEGWSCDPVGNSGADMTFVCIAERHVPCLPCRTDADCGGGQDLCLQVGAGTYCGQNCERNDCPADYDCRDITNDADEVVSRQCQPTSNSCKPCVDEDGDGYGLGEDCDGIDCDETDPTVNAGATEVCDGRDNDCDSVPDDGVVPPDDFVCLDQGVCAETAPACRSGEWICPYPETYEPESEVRCDELDNDCDGLIDDDFDFVNDPAHCGRCGHVCGFPNAEPICAVGACAIGTCFGGFWNVDGNQANGCEYACQRTNEGVEQCDDIDNNCDGHIDESFDVQNDTNNCGACGTICAYVHAVPACQRGACALDHCDAGFVDANLDATDGCEYVCELSNEGVEVCDAVDNDCDGLVDDGFDLQVDIGNCGVCGRGCSYPAADATCEQGLCAMADCSPGFWDVDRRAENGCEYACQLTRNGQEICDTLDNDCDGVVDNGFALDVDPFNCGGCNATCEYGNANALCAGGSCVMGACDLGFVDADLDAGNGCEYECTPDADSAEVCDERDNNCDARVDELFDLATDVEHCGACDSPCRLDSARAECVEASCRILQCEDGHFDLDSDPANGCEYQCPGDGGAERCDSIDNDCDGLADEDFDLQGDSANCGRCGVACGYAHAGASCQAGECQMEACDDGFWDLRNGAADGCEYACRVTLGGQETCDTIDNDCNGAVDDGFNLQNDTDHCGRCNNRCAYNNATPECNAGTCRLGPCAPGFLDQNHDPADGCEYGCVASNGGVEACDGIDNDCDRQVDETFDLATDVNNCGGCGTACSFPEAGARCVARNCQLGPCNPGHVNLNGLAEDGCEYACAPTNGGVERCDGVDNNCEGNLDENYDLQADLANCGRCGVVCAFDFGIPVCDRGGCLMVGCVPGHYDVDAMTFNGCEYACVPSNSGVEACDGIDNDCDGAIDEGYDTRTDVRNCGGCGNACDTPFATPACVASQCEIGACNAGRVDLDDSPGNGCEYACTPSNDGLEICDVRDNDCDGLVDDGFDLTRDVNNCGSCGLSCVRPHAVTACNNRACAFNGCAAGFWNIDGNWDNGCEYACDFVSNADLPDARYQDANCDGIDGDAARACYVATNGADAGNCTRAAPCRTFTFALGRASALGFAQVLVSSGPFTEQVTLSNGIGLFGGYNRAQNWTRDIAAFVTTINGAPKAIIANNISSSTAVQGFTLTSPAAVNPGESSIVVYAQNSTSQLVLANNIITAGNGAAGSAGAAGSPGDNATAGGAGQVGCDGCNGNGNGGSAGGSTCGSAGGAGGRGGYGSGGGANGAAGAGPSGGSPGGGGAGDGSHSCAFGCGSGGDPGAAGGNGGAGVAGANGAGGSAAGSIVAGVWQPSPGAAGLVGAHGSGGGGGGGGGGTDCCLDDRGGGGGGGGGGGCRGTAGTPGSGGGGSFGIYLNASSPRILSNRITSGRGGNGGAGGAGGAGGVGGSLGAFGAGADNGDRGGNGGNGTAGGRGGHGGGGGGGVSYCTYRAAGSAPDANDLATNATIVGAGGNGGASSGNSGANGANGATF